MQFRRRIALALATVLAAVTLTPLTASPAQAGPAAELALKAMTYNVLYAGADTSGKFPNIPAADLAWDLRDDQVAAWVEREDPDVIGFQENLDEVPVNGQDVLQLNTVAPLLPDYTFAHLGNANPIAFRTSMFTLVDSGATRLATADGTTLLRDRWATWVELTDKPSGRSFVVFNTHLSAASEGSAAASARVAQTRRLNTLIAEVSGGMQQPFLLLGDLNTKEGSTGTTGQPLQLLADAGLVNASQWRVEAEPDIPGAVSLQSMTARVNGTLTYRAVRLSGSTLDYVWVPKGAVVDSYRVSTGPHTERRTVAGVDYWFYADDWVIPSDHAPVVAEVSFDPAITTLGAGSVVLGGYTVTGKVYETWLKHGGAAALGLPTSNRWRAELSGRGIWTQRFAKAEIFWASTTVQVVRFPDAPRLSGVGNFRDALASSGMKPGRLYRSAHLVDATRTSRLVLAGALAGGTIIDLRTLSAVRKYPDPSVPGVTRVRYAVPTGAEYELYVTSKSRRAAFASALKTAAASKGSVLIHCTKGRDRTGWTVAMLMYAAGATDAQVAAEFARTPTAPVDDFAAAVALAKQLYGSMDGYLSAGLGLTTSQLAALKAKFG